eukprot:3910084-Pyramimonas_sp.AAC.1
MLEVAQRFGGLALGEVRCVDSDAGDSIEDDYAENDDPVMVNATTTTIATSTMIIMILLVIGRK